MFRTTFEEFVGLLPEIPERIEGHAGTVTVCTRQCTSQKSDKQILDHGVLHPRVPVPHHGDFDAVARIRTD